MCAQINSMHWNVTPGRHTLGNVFKITRCVSACKSHQAVEIAPILFSFYFGTSHLRTYPFQQQFISESPALLDCWRMISFDFVFNQSCLHAALHSPPASFGNANNSKSNQCPSDIVDNKDVAASTYTTTSSNFVVDSGKHVPCKRHASAHFEAAETLMVWKVGCLLCCLLLVHLLKLTYLCSNAKIFLLFLVINTNCFKNFN